MKKLSYMLLLLLVALCAASCSNDEPDYNRKPDLKRPQDGNGKVFIENGKLVEANMNFTRELTDALNNYEWEREYFFYYDNNTVSGKLLNINALPVKIHTDKDKKMEYLYLLEGGHTRTSYREVVIKGKLLIAAQPSATIDGSIYPADEFIVVSLDKADGGGRMVLDYKLHREVTGYDINSSYVRMVWKIVPSE